MTPTTNPAAPRYLCGLSIRQREDDFAVKYQDRTLFEGTEAECIQWRQAKVDEATPLLDAFAIEGLRKQDQVLTIKEEIEEEFGASAIRDHSTRAGHVQYFLYSDGGYVFGDAYKSQQETLDGEPISAEFAALYRLRDCARYQREQNAAARRRPVSPEHGEAA